MLSDRKGSGRSLFLHMQNDNVEIEPVTSRFQGQQATELN